MNYFLKHSLMFFVITVILLATGSLQANRPASRRGFQSPCGTAEQVSHSLGQCLQPIFDMIEGKFGEPRSDNDLVENCNRFNNTEKCMRVIAKDCLTGLHKTSVSSVPTAIRKFRSAECKSEQSRQKYSDPMKCTVKNGRSVAALYRNMTGIAQGVRDLPIPPEEKVVKICCLLALLDREIEAIFNKECPKSTPIILGLIQAITDDARNTLCAKPKCGGALNPVLRHQYRPTQNFIEPVMQILFLLNTSE